jgi:hypothetical protein
MGKVEQDQLAQRYFWDGRLIAIPRRRRARLAVLDLIARVFEPWPALRRARRQPGAVQVPPGGRSVLAFLESLLGRWAKSSLSWVVSNFRPFLVFTGRADLVDALGLAGVRRSRPIIPVLSDEVEEMVIRACASGAVSARDAAVTLLALTTGATSV